MTISRIRRNAVGGRGQHPICGIAFWPEFRQAKRAGGRAAPRRSWPRSGNTNAGLLPAIPWVPEAASHSLRNQKQPRVVVSVSRRIAAHYVAMRSRTPLSGPRKRAAPSQASLSLDRDGRLCKL